MTQNVFGGGSIQQWHLLGITADVCEGSHVGRATTELLRRPLLRLEIPSCGARQFTVH